jgi:hypothetical protein
MPAWIAYWRGILHFAHPMGLVLTAPVLVAKVPATASWSCDRNRASVPLGSPLGEKAHFALDECAIKPVSLHEVVRRTVLHHSPRLQNDDAIEISQGGQPVRDGNHRAPPHQASQRDLNLLFGFAVES